MKRRRRVIWSVAALVIGAVLAVGLTRGGPVQAPPIALDGDRPLPKVVGPDLVSGAPIDLTSYRGKPLIINLRASWCIPCRDEAPHFVRLAREHPEVALVGIDINNARADATAFNSEAGWTHPSIYDPDGSIGLDTLGVANLPTTIYVGAAGVMRGRTNGPITYEDLEYVARGIT